MKKKTKNSRLAVVLPKGVLCVVVFEPNENAMMGLVLYTIILQ